MGMGGESFPHARKTRGCLEDTAGGDVDGESDYAEGLGQREGCKESFRGLREYRYHRGPNGGGNTDVKGKVSGRNEEHVMRSGGIRFLLQAAENLAELFLAFCGRLDIWLGYS